MANVSITLSGIAEVIENLNYRQGSVKDNAVRGIFAYYVSEDSIQALSSIDGDSIIRQIWEVGDDYAKIKFKRRNFERQGAYAWLRAIGIYYTIRFQ